MEEDFFKKLNSIKVQEENANNKSNQDSRRKKREIDDFILHFDIEEDDDELVSSVKNLINNSNVYKSQLYEIIGRSEGYNMIYSLQKSTLSWKRCEKWCEFLGYKIDLSFQKKI